MLGVAAIDGHDEAILKLKWWGENRWNESRLMHLASNSLVAAVNAPKRPPDQAVVEEKAAETQRRSQIQRASSMRPKIMPETDAIRNKTSPSAAIVPVVAIIVFSLFGGHGPIAYRIRR